MQHSPSCLKSTLVFKFLVHLYVFSAYIHKLKWLKVHWTRDYEFKLELKCKGRDSPPDTAQLWWWWWRGGRDDQHMSSLSAQLGSVREQELMRVRREGLPCWKFLHVTHIRSEGTPVILTHPAWEIPLRSAPKPTHTLPRNSRSHTHMHACMHTPTLTHAHTSDGMQRGPVLSDGMCAHETSILNQPLQELRPESQRHTQRERERERRGGKQHSRERKRREIAREIQL